MKNGIMIIALLAMMFGSVQQARAASYELLIHNNTEDNVKVFLEGPESHSEIFTPGKHSFEVEEGTYEVSYTSCEEEKYETVEVDTQITVDGEGLWLVIERCEKPDVPAKFVINSHFGDPITVAMSGPREYELSVTLGKNKFLDIISGTYFYSYSACEGQITGSIYVAQNGTSQLKMLSCERQHLLSHGLPNPSNLRMGSYYAFPINLTLIGEHQYYLQLQPGYNRLNVLRGDYTYLYSAFGKQYSGTVSVTGGGNWVVFSPLAPSP